MKEDAKEERKKETGEKECDGLDDGGMEESEEGIKKRTGGMHRWRDEGGREAGK